MTEERHKGKLLQTKIEIMTEYKLTRAVLQSFLKVGMPVAVIGGRYYAHTDNLDRFFVAITNKAAAHAPEDAE